MNHWQDDDPASDGFETNDPNIHQPKRFLFITPLFA
jgi:hypothetical protein